MNVHDIDPETSVVSALPGDAQRKTHLMHQFACNVATRPQQDAVRYGDTALSYAELDRRANALAHHLRARGVVSTSHVGVYLRPCLESIVALIAILKLRAVYVPLDTDFPAARLAVILDDVKPHVILSDTALYAQLDAAGDGWSERALAVTALDLQREEFCDECIAEADDPQQPAYVFYTSGTTGKPKGVVGTQQNLTHYINSALARFHTDFTLVMPAIARFTFSISLFELLCPLISGGTLLVLDRDHVLNPPQLAKTLQAATMLHMGPSLFKNMIAWLQQNYSSFEAFDNLRHVSMGGDIVPPSVLCKLPDIFRNAELFVIYGCSEIACMGCHYAVDARSRFEKPLVGVAFPQVGLKLLDEAGHAVAAGELGEVYFSGPGVTAGYLNLDALTAQKYAAIDGERFYRTGDLGRIDGDGNLEVVGRADFQVKIRGIRIELGEIEAHLLQCVGVRDVIVTAVPTDNDERALCAYLVLKDDSAAFDSAALHAYLAERVPDYMVPVYYMQLAKLPLNHNLKLDRSALPLPDKSHLVDAGDYVAPQNDTEIALIAIWEDILQAEGIGVTHNFFHLGGDSLLAARFIVEIDKRFGRQVSVANFLRAPTIREFASLLTQPAAASAESSDCFVFRAANGRRIFLLHGALVYRDLANAIDSNVGVSAIFADEEAKLIGARSTSEVFRIYQSVEAIAQRYYDEVRRQQPEGPYYLAGFSMGGLVTMEVAQMLSRAGCEVAGVFLFDCYLPAFFGQFYWDKVFANIGKVLSKGLPHLKYMAQQLLTRASERRSLQAIHASDAPLDEDDLENVRYLARRHASDNYVPRSYAGNVVLFRALRRPAIGYVPEDRTLGWKKYLRNLSVHDIDGEHLDILNGNEAKLIASIINANINGAPASTYAPTLVARASWQPV